MIAAYVVVGLLWIAVVPPFESPDEIHHFAYTQFVAQTGRLPVQKQEVFPFLEHEAHQPPLYYVMSAAVYRAANGLGIEPSHLQLWEARINPNFQGRSQGPRTDDNFFVHGESFLRPGVVFPYDLIAVRLFSLGLGAAALVVLYVTGLRAWPGHALSAFAAVGLVGFLPQFSFITASANNDNLAIAFGALCIFQITRIATGPKIRGVRRYFVLGLCLGIGVLAKLTLLSLLPVAILLPLARRRPPRTLAAVWGALAAGVLLVSGWWFTRNLVLYADLLGDHWTINPAAFAWDLDPKPLWSSYFLPQHFWRQTAESFVGRFGFMHISLPFPLYAIYLGIFCLGFAGAAALLLRRRAGVISRRLLLILLGVIVLAVGQLVYLNLRVSQPQGRYLFHTVAAIAIVVVSGLRWIGAAIIANRTLPRAGLLYLCFALLVGMNLYVLQRLHTVYAEPSSISLISALFAPLR